MKILITGSNGFLGWYLVRDLIDKGYEVIATGKGDSTFNYQGNSLFRYIEMDFTDPFSVHDVFTAIKPEVVIHAGAMSKPDDCEQQQWQAFLTNVEGTVTLLNNAAEHKSFFIFLSTDFVFDGQRGLYTEDDVPGPINYYGRTKLEAEDAVREYEHQWAIIRTVLVYGKSRGTRNNLVTVVADKLNRGESYSVFDDQQRTPTYVEDLSAAIVTIIQQRAGGIFHISGEELLTPYEMACKTASLLQADSSLIKKVTAKDFVQPAKRPLKTGFNIEKAKRILGFSPLSFEEGLRKTFS